MSLQKVARSVLFDFVQFCPFSPGFVRFCSILIVFGIPASPSVISLPGPSVSAYCSFLFRFRHGSETFRLQRGAVAQRSECRTRFESRWLRFGATSKVHGLNKSRVPSHNGGTIYRVAI